MTDFDFKAALADIFGDAGTQMGTPEEQLRPFTVNGVSFNMVYVQGGTFTMGATPEQEEDADGDESPAHKVTLSDYYIGETVVTQALWTAVMGNDVKNQRDKADPEWTLHGVGDSNPMYYVSWHETQEFIQKLNKLTGKTFRLPTEAEWEYAARGGYKSKGYKYAGGNNLDEVAWYEGNSDDETHPVKRKKPNELGLYDMSGNVWEWCGDWFDDYDGASQTNPKGPASGSSRVFRGGGWNDYAGGCRVSFRYCDDPGNRDCILGLRLVVLP